MRSYGFDGQPALFEVPRQLFTCTPSKLGAFEDCPRRYRYTYLDRPAPRKGPPWAHNSLGTSVHSALRTWYSLSPERRERSSVPAILRSVWVSDGYRDEDQSESLFHRAVRWLDDYLADLDPTEEPLGVERVVATKTGTIAVSGRADRIDRRGKSLVIVDYKTGRSSPSPDDARGSRALALYAFAAGRMFRIPCHRVELHHLPTGTVCAHDHTQESLSRHVRRAEDLARDATLAEERMRRGTGPDEAFPAAVSARCSWCDYRRACDQGNVMPALESWAAVEGRGVDIPLAPGT